MKKEDKKTNQQSPKVKVSPNLVNLPQISSLLQPPKERKIMKTYLLIKTDVRSEWEGYHFNVWEEILDCFELPAETAQIDIVAHRAKGRDGKLLYELTI